MRLQPGFPIVVYPTFHMPADLRACVSLGAGVERNQDAFLAKPSWRRPDEQEFQLIFGDVKPSQNLLDCLGLFQLPQHLCATWWTILENSPSAGVFRIDGFDRFVADVVNFLNYKELGVPPGATFELLLTKPGQRSLGRPGRPLGLALEGTTQGSLWGGINLGDEPTSLVFVNLLAAMLRAELTRCHPGEAPPEPEHELAAHFLTRCHDYPPTRLRLDPGEGFRLPRGGFLFDGDTSEKQEPNLLLLISAA